MVVVMMMVMMMMMMMMVMMMLTMTTTQTAAPCQQQHQPTPDPGTASSWRCAACIQDAASGEYGYVETKKKYGPRGLPQCCFVTVCCRSVYL